MKLSIFTSKKSDGNMNNLENINKYLSRMNLDGNKAIIMNNLNVKKSSHSVVEGNNKLKDRILILKENVKNIPVVVETDDEPIIVAYAEDDNNKQIAVIAKASIDNLNTDLIHDMTEVLMKESNKATFEMKFFIGPCPSKDNYPVDKKQELNDKIFGKAVENNKLDLRYAIFNQLYLEIVDPSCIYFDSNDTVEDDYFSTIGKKQGEHISCVVFTDEEV